MVIAAPELKAESQRLGEQRVVLRGFGMHIYRFSMPYRNLALLG